jgi:hypothetical protein
MTKRKRANRPKGELKFEFTEQLKLLRHACQAYDGGLEAIGKHIALSVRVLVHAHGQSRALLEQLGYGSIKFGDSAGPLNPRNILSEHLLVSIRVSDSGARYLPIYDGPRPLRPVAFVRWWNDPVIKDQAGIKFCRRELILNVADTDGGAHVDPELDEQYLALSRANSLGWQFSKGDVSKAFDGRVELACVRQIGHELLWSIHKFVPEFSDEAVPVVPSDSALLGAYPST